MENAEVDNHGKVVSQYCLGLPEILRQILERFPTKELIELSLVNKLWNFEARSAMRERGNVTAKILHGVFRDGCQFESISEFASDLENMPVIPFSGIRLDISHDSDACPIQTGQLASSCKVILDLLPWKHFSVHYKDRRDCCPNCPTLVLIKQILEGCCGLLEDLTLEFGEQELLSIIQERTFPRLKYFTFGITSPLFLEFPCKSTFVKALVSRAPNLQELRLRPIYISLTMNVLEGSSAVLVPIYQIHPLTFPICEELIGSVRAQEINLCTDIMRTHPELLNSSIPELLKASHTTLKTFVMDLFSAVPFMCYEICLGNVTTLEIHVNYNSLDKIDPSILALAKCFDFTRVFPKLEQVAIVEDLSIEPEFSFDVVSAFVQQANELMSRGLPERAINIKLLFLRVSYLFRPMEDSTLSFLAQMFPGVKTDGNQITQV